MQIKSNWMIAVIIGFQQSVVFFFMSEPCLPRHLDVTGTSTGHSHRSLWKQKDHLFVRRPFHAWLLRCWKLKLSDCCCSVFMRDSVIRYFVFLLCWLRSTQSSKGAFSPNLWTLFVVIPCKLAGFLAPEWVRTIWTWCKAFVFRI